MYKLLRLLTTLFFVSAMPTTLLCMNLNIFYVGQGSFSMLRPLNTDVKSALIYDCGYDGGSNWIVDKKLADKKKQVLGSKLNDISNVFIVISHHDEDHYCLLPFLIKDVICNKYIHLFARDDYLTKLGFCNTDLCNFYSAENKVQSQNFTTLITESFKNFSFDFKIPLTFKKKNDMSIVLKVTYNTQNHDKQAILFTGDASKKTLDNLALDDDFWKDIKVFIAPHHGSNCNQELEWAEKVIEKSKQTPVVTIISSHPAYQDRFPDLDTVAKLYKYYNADNNSNIDDTDNNSNIDDTDTHAVPCFFTSAKVDLQRFTISKKDEEDKLKPLISQKDMSAVLEMYNYKVMLKVPIFVTSSLLKADPLQESYNVIINQSVNINGKYITTLGSSGAFIPSLIWEDIQCEDTCLNNMCQSIMEQNKQMVANIQKTVMS